VRKKKKKEDEYIVADLCRLAAAAVVIPQASTGGIGQTLYRQSIQFIKTKKTTLYICDSNFSVFHADICVSIDVKKRSRKIKKLKT